MYQLRLKIYAFIFFYFKFQFPSKNCIMDKRCSKVKILLFANYNLWRSLEIEEFRHKQILEGPAIIVI